VCREPPVVPQGWQFVPLLDDRLVIVCRADNPLAQARRVGWKQLAGETWMLLPAGLAARQHFDDLIEEFPNPPKVHPLVTRTTAMMWELLRRENLLTLLPLNLVRPLVNSGELVELNCGYDMPIKPLGLLIPEGELGHGAARLSSFLRELFARGRARKRAV
jgi:DNA-binding transcriptional LysR family regulator